MGVGVGRLSEKRYENLLFLPVKVSEKEITSFVDTGARLTFIKESLAGALGIIKVSEVTGGNNQGKLRPFGMGILKELDLFGLKIPDLPIGILPDGALAFPEDANGNLFPGEMILGYDVLSQFSVDINLKNRIIKVSRNGMLDEGIPLVEGPLPMFHVKVQGEKALFGFDTGHTETMLSEVFYPLAENQKVEIETLSGIGSSSEEPVKVLPKFMVMMDGGEWILKMISVYPRKLHGFPELSGLFGMDLIQGNGVILDHLKKRISFY